MKLKLKDTCCSFCASGLVVIDGVLKCEEDHEQRTTGWHKDTQAKIDGALEYIANSLQETR